MRRVPRAVKSGPGRILIKFLGSESPVARSCTGVVTATIYEHAHWQLLSRWTRTTLRLRSRLGLEVSGPRMPWINFSICGESNIIILQNRKY